MHQYRVVAVYVYVCKGNADRYLANFVLSMLILKKVWPILDRICNCHIVRTPFPFNI